MGAAIPDGVVKVAESGVRDRDDARRLADAGYDAILVGETLVTSPTPPRPSATSGPDASECFSTRRETSDARNGTCSGLGVAGTLTGACS